MHHALFLLFTRPHFAKSCCGFDWPQVPVMSSATAAEVLQLLMRLVAHGATLKGPWAEACLTVVHASYVLDASRPWTSGRAETAKGVLTPGEQMVRHSNIP